MSWSVNASGKPAEVRGQLSEQFKYPLAEAPAGLSDEGERVTVQQVSDLLEQILSTFDPEKEVSISANGHMGFADWDAKTGCYQNVTINVAPKSPTIIK
jgi:hypothetical protein